MNMKVNRNCGVLAAVMLVLLLPPAFGAEGVHLKLTGRNDAGLDRAAIQEAIDYSAPDQPLTIKLQGVFQLDGRDPIIVDRSDLTIKGDKKGALLKGKLGPGGLPIDDIDNFPNRGILIDSADAPLGNIEIKDLAMTGFRTSVFVRSTTNPIDNVSVKHNRVENSFFGVVVSGLASDVTIAYNRVQGASSAAITVAGNDSGQPSDLKITANHLSDAGDAALWINGVDGATVADNFLATADVLEYPTPLFVSGSNSDVVVTGNSLEGGGSGAFLVDASTNFVLTMNCIRNGGAQGFFPHKGGGITVGFSFFGWPGSGFEIMDNSYASNLPNDVWLTATSSNSTVTEKNGTSVLDDGSSNSVALIPDDGTTYCSD